MLLASQEVEEDIELLAEADALPDSVNIGLEIMAVNVC